jgi:hypothetical protein
MYWSLIISNLHVWLFVLRGLCETSIRMPKEGEPPGRQASRKGGPIIWTAEVSGQRTIGVIPPISLRRGGFRPVAPSAGAKPVSTAAVPVGEPVGEDDRAAVMGGDRTVGVIRWSAPLQETRTGGGHAGDDRVTGKNSFLTKTY